MHTYQQKRFTGPTSLEYIIPSPLAVAAGTLAEAVCARTQHLCSPSRVDPGYASPVEAGCWQPTEKQELPEQKLLSQLGYLMQLRMGFVSSRVHPSMLTIHYPQVSITSSAAQGVSGTHHHSAFSQKMHGGTGTSLLIGRRSVIGNRHNFQRLKPHAH